jgi:hypothetical protein
VERVDWLLREFHCELLVLGHGGIFGHGLPDGTLSSIANSPDWT